MGAAFMPGRAIHSAPASEGRNEYHTHRRRRKQEQTPNSHSDLFGYGIALAATGAMFGVRLLLTPLWGQDASLGAFTFSVLVAARWGGFGPCLFATLLALCLGRWCFIEPQYTLGLANVSPANLLRLALFGLLGLVIALLARSRQRDQREVETSVVALNASARKQRIFLREVLLVATECRLHLCDVAEELPATPSGSSGAGDTWPALTPVTGGTLQRIRHLALSAGQAVGLPADKLYDFMSGVGEAAMNAVVHGGGGEASIHVDTRRGVVQARIWDRGGGIAEGTLHRATLERGYSSAGSLGHGFWLMIHTCDRIFLLTGPEGTTVILEQDRTSRDEGSTPWMAELGGVQANESARSPETVAA